MQNGADMNKNIVIFYVPGAMGSFVSWMLERFNTLRTDVIDNPLTNNGSSHGYASLCSVESIDSVYSFLDDTNFPNWGYKIWAGWPVDKSNSIDHCIQQTLLKMKPQDRLILITRNTEEEYNTRSECCDGFVCRWIGTALLIIWFVTLFTLFYTVVDVNVE